MKKDLLIGITCTDKDLNTFRDSLIASMNNFLQAFYRDVFILVIYQCDAENEMANFDRFLEVPSGQIQVKNAYYRSVSVARNEIIEYAYKYNFSHIIFHDVRIFFEPKYCSWIRSNIGGCLLSGTIKFGKQFSDTEAQNLNKVVSYKPIRDTYVYAFVFPTSLTIPKFDPNYGPGSRSLYKCGEDVIFMAKLMKSNPSAQKFLRFFSGGVIHPARPKDYSKHLEYAFGQGKAYRIILSEYRSASVLYRLLLFFGMALVRLILLRKNAFNILIRRLRGFLSR